MKIEEYKLAFEFDENDSLTKIIILWVLSLLGLFGSLMAEQVTGVAGFFVAVVLCVALFEGKAECILDSL